jgi:hypothetical protein
MVELPSIVLVHGLWGGAAHWAKAIVELDRSGHKGSRAVELPLTSLADDAARTRKMVALDAGHASLASRPVEVAALIDEAARSL